MPGDPRLVAPRILLLCNFGLTWTRTWKFFVNFFRTWKFCLSIFSQKNITMGFKGSNRVSILGLKVFNYGGWFYASVKVPMPGDPRLVPPSNSAPLSLWFDSTYFKVN